MQRHSLEELANEFGFGLFYVPGAVPQYLVDRWGEGVDRMFSRLLET